MLKTKWSENVILVDGDYVDKVTFDLIVNFERMLMRRIPNADLAHWLECIALDGGIRPLGEEKKEERQIQVIFVHKNDRLQYFNPSSYTDDIDGKAFNSNIAEFLLTGGAWKEENTELNDYTGYFCEVLEMLATTKDIKRIMVIPNAEQYLYEVKSRLKDITDKDITVFTMQPQAGGNYKQEILGYSLLSALGISATEIEQSK
ncbi:MAG: hypothetical protein KBS65_02335 [Prevotella sp.]|nr:hypothetical protein [Candidatus Equicola stercoris]